MLLLNITFWMLQFLYMFIIICLSLINMIRVIYGWRETTYLGPASWFVIVRCIISWEKLPLVVAGRWWYFWPKLFSPPALKMLLCFEYALSLLLAHSQSEGKPLQAVTHLLLASFCQSSIFRPPGCCFDMYWYFGCTKLKDLQN